jgi:hypothetical protein
VENVESKLYHSQAHNHRKSAFRLWTWCLQYQNIYLSEALDDKKDDKWRFKKIIDETRIGTHTAEALTQTGIAITCMNTEVEANVRQDSLFSHSHESLYRDKVRYTCRHRVYGA